MDISNEMSFYGSVSWELYDADMVLIDSGRCKNLVTAVGDRLYASRGAGLTTSAVPNGMKLGTGTTAASKSGGGAAVGSYVAGSNKGFDSGYPAEANGTATYKCTYPPGVATSATAIAEVVLVTDAGTDGASTAANTIARVTIGSPSAKGSNETLILVWAHVLVGA